VSGRKRTIHDRHKNRRGTQTRPRKELRTKANINSTRRPEKNRESTFEEGALNRIPVELSKTEQEKLVTKKKAKGSLRTGGNAPTLSDNTGLERGGATKK